jgi:hypothetical protein
MEQSGRDSVARQGQSGECDQAIVNSVGSTFNLVRSVFACPSRFDDLPKSATACSKTRSMEVRYIRAARMKITEMLSADIAAMTGSLRAR